MVCRAALCAIHGVTKHRIVRIATALRNKTSAPPDMRGKHSSRPNKIPNNILCTIDNHIKSFPRRSSHYSREKNEGRTYLSSELNVSKMHSLYLQKYEIDIFEKLKRNEECKPRVTYDFYFRRFCTNHNISFGSPRSDTCQTCDRLQNAIQAEQDAHVKTALQTEKNLHIRKSESFYTALKEKTALAKTDNSIEVLCFDFQQNLPLPHVPAGDVFYKRQLWLYNFCVSSGQLGCSTFYMYDEVTSKKGSNEVISFLEHYIENFLPDTVTRLYLFSDNAFAQNKNHTMVKYLYTLVNTSNRIKEVVHRYPEPGHSFLPCDRAFGLIKKEKRKKERVHVPEEWMDLVRKTSKLFRVVEVNQEMVRDFNNHFKPMFKATFSSTEKSKFLISSYRIFKYEKGSNFVECSLATGMPLFTKYSALKSGTTLFSLPTYKMTQAYPLPINEKKVKDVKTLVEKYVPGADQWYYKQIFGEEPTAEPPREDETVEDTVYDSDSSFF